MNHLRKPALSRSCTAAILSLSLSLILVSCEKHPNTPDGAFTLTVDKPSLQADGKDAVVFTVKLNDREVTSDAVIKRDGEAIEGSTFSTTAAGRYSFTAEYDGRVSNKVDVEATAVPSRIVLSHTLTTRKRGAKFTIKALVMPAGTSAGIKWTSSNASVASVDGDVFTALASGASILTASAEGMDDVTCKLTVEGTCGETDGLGAGGVGTASFKSGETWTVGEQEWSDVVLTSNCTAKTTYKGGTSSGDFNSDCRDNPGYGNLYSWCAVIKYQDILCPDGWRVPTRDEFIALDVALGFSGSTTETTAEEIRNTYLSPTKWGGALAGNCTPYDSMAGPSGTLSGQGENVSYWASDEYVGGNGHCNYISISENAEWGTKPLVQADSFMSMFDYGQNLRCIRTI